ncbi:unnamed protein product [Prunus armeniaca]
MVQFLLLMVDLDNEVALRDRRGGDVGRAGRMEVSELTSSCNWVPELVFEAIRSSNSLIRSN